MDFGHGTNMVAVVITALLFIRKIDAEFATHDLEVIQIPYG